MNGTIRLTGPYFQTDLFQTRLQHIKIGCGFVGKVYDTTSFERAPVVDANQGLAAITKVYHTDQRAEGKGTVGGGVRIHIEALAVRRLPAMKLPAIPRGYPIVDFDVADTFRAFDPQLCR